MGCKQGEIFNHQQISSAIQKIIPEQNKTETRRKAKANHQENQKQCTIETQCVLAQRRHKDKAANIQQDGSKNTIPKMEENRIPYSRGSANSVFFTFTSSPLVASYNLLGSLRTTNTQQMWAIIDQLYLPSITFLKSLSTYNLLCNFCSAN